ncbi:MAG TPA: GlsB/YeaQ/YmgE family stress response membrane protein [Vicinamibacteria bacterium]|jgi:uncharacterized membrane protein YeaQ/YmgE (transglycosylase-associated protein family)
MDLIMTLVTGGLVGWLASVVMAAGRQMSLPGYVLVGVVGSVIGRWLVGVLGIAVQGSSGQWLVSFAGAALLVWLVRAVAGTEATPA